MSTVKYVGLSAAVLVAPLLGLAAANGADSAAAALPPVRATGQWPLDRIIDSTHRTPDADTTTTTSDGILDDDTTVVDNVTPSDERARPIALTGTGSLYFPGWKNALPDGPDGDRKPDVDPTDSSVRVPNKASHNPLTKSFRVEVYVRPDALVIGAGSALTSNANPNIVQKGLIPTAGQPDTKGIWKVWMDADMQPACTFRGDTDPSAAFAFVAREARMNVDAAIMAPDRDYLIRCDLDNRSVVGGENSSVTATLLAKTDVGGQPQFTEVASKTTSFAPGYFNVQTNLNLWIGKKTDSTDPDNAFAGAIDDLTISRSR